MDQEQDEFFAQIKAADTFGAINCGLKMTPYQQAGLSASMAAANSLNGIRMKQNTLGLRILPVPQWLMVLIYISIVYSH